MTTTSRSSASACNTDAGFRAWIIEYQSMLAAIGMVQTSDTGQVNTTTVTRPATSGVAQGYDIWRFNDALQSTAPLFVKIEYTVYHVTTNNQGCVYITVGTGTNGAGTITGTQSSRLFVGMSASMGGDYEFVNAYPSYACHVEGVAWLARHIGSNSGPNYGRSPPTAWHIERFSDADGTPNGNGFTVTYNNSGTSPTSISYYSTSHNWQAVRTQATAVVFAAVSGQHGLWPGTLGNAMPSTTQAGDLQLMPLWTITKEVQQQWALVSYVATEISQGSTFSTAVKGTTPRTYIALGGGFGAVNYQQCVCAAVWE